MQGQAGHAGESCFLAILFLHVFVLMSDGYGDVVGIGRLYDDDDDVRRGGGGGERGGERRGELVVDREGGLRGCECGRLGGCVGVFYL